MPHSIILLDEIDCINKRLNSMKKAYDDLKTYRQSAPPADHAAIDAELHTTEHFAADMCAGNSLSDSIQGRAAAMAALMP